MKVRDEPTTPCTSEILPASRLESWARNSVGRRSASSRSFSSAPGIGGVAAGGEDRLVGRIVALAAAGGDDHVHALEQLGVALDPGGVQREAGGVHADALPGLHLPLVAALGDLLVQLQRRHRMHRPRGEARRVHHRAKPAGRVQRGPVRVRALAQAGHQADPGDQRVAVSRHWQSLGLVTRQDMPPAPPRGAPSPASAPRSVSLGNGTTP